MNRSDHIFRGEVCRSAGDASRTAHNQTILYYGQNSECLCNGYIVVQSSIWPRVQGEISRRFIFLIALSAQYTIYCPVLNAILLRQTENHLCALGFLKLYDILFAQVEPQRRRAGYIEQYLSILMIYNGATFAQVVGSMATDLSISAFLLAKNYGKRILLSYLVMLFLGTALLLTSIRTRTRGEKGGGKRGGKYATS